MIPYDKIAWNAMFYKLTKDREKMLYICTRMINLKNDTKGATTVEYVIIVAAVAALVTTGVAFLGGGFTTAFKAICSTISGSTCA